MMTNHQLLAMCSAQLGYQAGHARGCPQNLLGFSVCSCSCRPSENHIMLSTIRSAIGLVHMSTGRRPDVLALTPASFALLYSEMAAKCLVLDVGDADSTMVDGVIVASARPPHVPGKIVASLSEEGVVDVVMPGHMDKISVTIKVAD